MIELTAHKADVTIPVYGTIADAEVYLKEKADEAIAEKDKEIAELKAALERDFVAKKSAEKVLRDLLDCGLIKEWFYNGTFHAVLKADDPHLEIAELKHKLEDVNDIIKAARHMLEDAKATAYAEMVDAGMRERRLKRALWLARSENAKIIAKIYSKEAELTLLREHYPSGCGFCHMMNNKWKNVERKCRAKAEQYK